ncbi:MAG: DUF3025 domain-containing protein [Nannocystis sp.]|nr:DUF3025 domain-containing protein [Nannocystis sp.]
MASLRVDTFVPRVWRRSPWMAEIAATAARFDGCEGWPEVASYGCAAAPVRFVEQRVGSSAGAYDARIVQHGEVLTRARCWHDFFNAMIWCTFPRAKMALHRRLSANTPAIRPPGGRTRAQDLWTILDEGGVLLVAPAASHEALRAEIAAQEPVHRGGARLERLPRHRAVAFGHALLEHVVVGAAVARASAILVAEEALTGAMNLSLDAWLEEHLSGAGELFAGGRIGYPVAPLGLAR